MKAWTIAIGLLGAALLAPPASADDEDAVRQERWQALKQAVFGDRPVADGAGIVALEAPSRALDAALVPIGIRLSGSVPVTALYLMIDDNPSPLAATVRFGPAADTREFRTRVRVNSYTLVHAVAETASGALFVAEAFVKAAGGCSAPATRDQQLALDRLGQMRLKPAGEAKAGAAEMLQLLISHPNFTGMQMDQVTRNFTPARFVQEVRVRTGDRLVLDLEADISLSEDPSITFGLASGGDPGAVTVEVRDSADTVVTRRFDRSPQGF
jgi:sulfur-oxidizing protein SoxY